MSQATTKKKSVTLSKSEIKRIEKAYEEAMNTVRGGSRKSMVDDFINGISLPLDLTGILPYSQRLMDMNESVLNAMDSVSVQVGKTLESAMRIMQWELLDVNKTEIEETGKFIRPRTEQTSR